MRMPALKEVMTRRRGGGMRGTEKHPKLLNQKVQRISRK